ncbi:helix-turn-helix domain-containing protein [Sporosarcina limicola]|uniref:DNA-binding transcriptional regulator AlpA n=1 Tax=Sporosarcina limicola TaxID=34101 RepID=A0A927R8B5_9BACL|nr:helix-turn-helix domain-containing protein [Sporosarcina limicola]MBE1556844.1 putative DNA-binding transcriptional regulator AlpA [Sporosarcina limicola]
MNDWYTRQQVADLIGISKATVYHYAKQKKIIKIDDPHRLIREARYKKNEVDALAEERQKNQPTGLRPSELAKQLGVTTQRIYALIRETHLTVDELPAGDERTIYSIPIETADWIRQEIRRTAPVRGTRAEFHDSGYDIAIFQLFRTKQGQDMRVLRNDKQEWGFNLPSQTWVSFMDGIHVYQYEPVYPIHHATIRVKGYTDFLLPKNLHESFDFLDFVYQVWGVENIRLREREKEIALSIKSGTVRLSIPVPETLTASMLQTFLILGDVVMEDGGWILVSGYRRTTFDLPTNMLDALQDISKEKDLSMSDYMEEALREKLEREMGT